MTASPAGTQGDRERWETVLATPRPPVSRNLPDVHAYPDGTVIEVDGKVYRSKTYEDFFGGYLDWGRIRVRANWYRRRARKASR